MHALTGIGVAGNFSEGYAINASGQVAGYSYTASYSITNGGSYHAFVTDATTQVLTDLGTLGGAASEASAINASGQVVGWSNTASGTQDGFLYTNGQMLDLNSLLDASDAAAYTISGATAINDNGQIVANGTSIATGQIVALLLNPVSN
jgi:probable HAF family extracellular repeat protein